MGNVEKILGGEEPHKQVAKINSVLETDKTRIPTIEAINHYRAKQLAKMHLADAKQEATNVTQQEVQELWRLLPRSIKEKLIDQSGQDVEEKFIDYNDETLLREAKSHNDKTIEAFVNASAENREKMTQLMRKMYLSPQGGFTRWTITSHIIAFQQATGAQVTGKIDFQKGGVVDKIMEFDAQAALDIFSRL